MLRFLRRTFGRRSMQRYARGAAGRGAAGLGDERDGGPRGGPAAAAASSTLPAAPGGSVFPAGGGPLLTGGAAVHISAAGAAKATLYCRVFLLDGTEVSVDLPVSDWAGPGHWHPLGQLPSPSVPLWAPLLHLSEESLPPSPASTPYPWFPLGPLRPGLFWNPFCGPCPLLGTLRCWVAPSPAPTSFFGLRSLPRSPSPLFPSPRPPGAGDRCSPSAPPPRFQRGPSWCWVSNAGLPRGGLLAPTKSPPGLVEMAGRRSPLPCCPAGAPSLGGNLGTISLPTPLDARPRPILIPKSPYSSQPRRGLGDLGANSRIDSLGPGQLCTGRALCWALGVGPGAPSGPGAPDSSPPHLRQLARAGRGTPARRRRVRGHPPTGGCTPPPSSSELGWRCCRRQGVQLSSPKGPDVIKLNAHINGRLLGTRRCGRRCLWGSLGVTEDTAPIELLDECHRSLRGFHAKKRTYPDFQRKRVGLPGWGKFFRLLEGTRSL